MRAKSTSPQRRFNNSPCRAPVESASTTRVRVEHLLGALNAALEPLERTRVGAETESFGEPFRPPLDTRHDLERADLVERIASHAFEVAIREYFMAFSTLPLSRCQCPTP